MHPKIERLRAWGCDIDPAMRRMLDDETFYLECLHAIPEDKSFRELALALERGDASAAFDHAHALKGILASLGLTPMYDKTVEIVEPLRAGRQEDLAAKMAELEEMRKRLDEILR